MIYAPAEPPSSTLESEAFQFDSFAPWSMAVGAAAGSYPRRGRLPVRIELGRARMHVSQVLEMGAGALVELDLSADSGVELYVNDQLVARADVLVQDGNYCIRVTERVGHATAGTSQPTRS